MPNDPKKLLTTLVKDVSNLTYKPQEGSAPIVQANSPQSTGQTQPTPTFTFKPAAPKPETQSKP